jgi:hypothetical protein
MENKNIFQKRSLVDQERHLALEMPTSETAHSEREREREHTCKTISRQNLPINMVINSRLLAFKAIGVSSISMTNSR